MRDGIGDPRRITYIAIHTKELTHLVMGSGANDREGQSRDPGSLGMYILTVALQEGAWEHEASYAPERAARPDAVELWSKVRTVSDPCWTSEFTGPAPLHKAHGGRVIVTYDDGSTFEDELRVANAHPSGGGPFGAEDYRRKFRSLTEGLVTRDETDRFLAATERLLKGGLDDLAALSAYATGRPARHASPGLFD